MPSAKPNEVKPLRVAMWSGPRNISTAMMRSWGNRPDTVVVDEPFYAFYLAATGKNHPGREEVMAAGQTDWPNAIDELERPLPAGKTVFFQKQMTHHLLPEVSRDWLSSMTNFFLIRDPAEVIRSYIKKNDEPTLEDIGFVQQAEIFDFVRQRSRQVPPVIDAHDVLENPERVLRLLCEAIGLPFEAAMLSWPPGLRETDGVWAKHWYGEVANSTGFREPSAQKRVELPQRLQNVHERSREYYSHLHQHRLR